MPEENPINIIDVETIFEYKFEYNPRCKKCNKIIDFGPFKQGECILCELCQKIN